MKSLFHRLTINVLAISALTVSLSTVAPPAMGQSASPANQASKNSTTTQSKSGAKGTYLGERLIDSAVIGTDGGLYAPQLSEFVKKFPECKFRNVSEYYVANCTVNNAARNRSRVSEPLDIYLTQSRAGVNAIDISQNQSDHEGGLSLFDKVDGIDIEKLSCPDIEIDNGASFNINFYRIKQASRIVGVYREIRSSGSGGDTTQTTVYLGMKDAPCQWSIQNDERLAQALQAAAQAGQANSKSQAASVSGSEDKKTLASLSAEVREGYELLSICAAAYEIFAANMTKNPPLMAQIRESSEMMRLMIRFNLIDSDANKLISTAEEFARSSLKNNVEALSTTVAACEQFNNSFAKGSKR